MKKAKHIVIMVPSMTSILDVAGPLEVFSKTIDYAKTNFASEPIPYITHVVSIEANTIVQTSSGLPLICEGNLNSINYPVDTMIIAGKGGAEPNSSVLSPIVDWLKTNIDNVRRVASICTGAFVLAEAGLLKGKRATSHWRSCDILAKNYPDIRVEKDPIFIKDGKIYTSAGISTGMDLALALVEEDLGREVAVNIARVLVLYLKRPGNQSQFSNILMHQQVDYQPVKDIQSWVMEHLDEEITVDSMAERALMSSRNFARVFLKETGITPAKYVEKMRLETARRRLEETHLTLEEISSECGIGSADSLRRLFIRHLKTTPSDYRNSFASAL